MTDIIHFHFKLIDIGRDKFSGDVHVQSYGELAGAVGQHLMSSEVDIAHNGAVLVGGWRPVGRVEAQTEQSKAALAEWCEPDETLGYEDDSERDMEGYAE